MKTFKEIKALLIDVEKREVREIIIENSLSAMYKVMKCDCIAVGLNIENRDCIYVDDEGLLKRQENFFHYVGSYQPLAGNGLVVGSHYTGATVDVKTSVKEVRENVKFLNLLNIQADFNSAQ